MNRRGFIKTIFAATAIASDPIKIASILIRDDPMPKVVKAVKAVIPMRGYSMQVDNLLKQVYLPALNDAVFHTNPLHQLLRKPGDSITFTKWGQ